jgi:hypothetical protein
MTPFLTKEISFVINRKLRILFFLTSLGKIMYVFLLFKYNGSRLVDVANF